MVNLHDEIEALQVQIPTSEGLHTDLPGLRSRRNKLAFALCILAFAHKEISDDHEYKAR